MNLFLRLIVSVYFIWSLGLEVTNSEAIADDLCEKWNTYEFFAQTNTSTLSHCLNSHSPNARGDFGETPLHYAARLNQNPEVIELLLKAGAHLHERDDFGETPLHYAAGFNQNPEVIELLLKAGAHLHERDDSGETPLHGAAGSSKNPEIIELLLKAGADLHERDDSGETPLHEAAWGNENLEIIELLLKAGADLHERDDSGETPLHEAAWGNENLKIIELLLKAGADPHARDDSGETPLHEAAGSSKNPEIIELLLKAGADLHERDDSGETPLHEAAWGNENLEIIELLLKAGADPHARDDLGETPLHEAVAGFRRIPEFITTLLAAGANPNVQDNFLGETPWQLARDRNDPAILAAFDEKKVAAYIAIQKKAAEDALKKQVNERLREEQVSCEEWNTPGFFSQISSSGLSRCLETKNPNEKDSQGWTPMHFAVAHSTSPDIVAVLAKAGANPNAKDSKSRTPLHIAAVFGKIPAVVTALIKAGADLDATDNKGRTPLQYAELFSETTVILDALREAEASDKLRVEVSISCKKWNTPQFFSQASLEDFSRCLKIEDPNAQNDNGRTPMHYAAQGDRPEVVIALANAGANMNTPDKKGGWTPLHIAAWFSTTPSVVAALIAAGADTSAIDNSGKTPWDYAQSNAVLKETPPLLAIKRGGSPMSNLAIKLGNKDQDKKIIDLLTFIDSYEFMRATNVFLVSLVLSIGVFSLGSLESLKAASEVDECYAEKYTTCSSFTTRIKIAEHHPIISNPLAGFIRSKGQWKITVRYEPVTSCAKIFFYLDMGPLDSLREYKRVFHDGGGVINDSGTFVHKTADAEKALQTVHSTCYVPDSKSEIQNAKSQESEALKIEREALELERERNKMEENREQLALEKKRSMLEEELRATQEKQKLDRQRALQSARDKNQSEHERRKLEEEIKFREYTEELVRLGKIEKQQELQRYQEEQRREQERQEHLEYDNSTMLEAFMTGIAVGLIDSVSDMLVNEFGGSTMSGEYSASGGTHCEQIGERLARDLEMAGSNHIGSMCNSARGMAQALIRARNDLAATNCASNWELEDWDRSIREAQATAKCIL